MKINDFDIKHILRVSYDCLELLHGIQSLFRKRFESFDILEISILPCKKSYK